jgi:transposase
LWKIYKEMAGNTLTMNKIRLVLQQHSQGRSKRSISRALGISRKTVRHYLDRFRSSGMSMDRLQALSEGELALLVFDRDHSTVILDHRYHQFSELLPDLSKDLSNPKVTRQLLWEEYRDQYPDGYGYTQFCHYLNQYTHRQHIRAMFEHHPAEVMQVDFAGSLLHYVDPDTGQRVGCQVLVCVLPYSGMTFCVALPSQKQADFVSGLVRALEYFGGVPRSILTDNLRSSVRKASRYEPSFTDLMEQLALHYGFTLMATRAGKPRDKATVEGAVNIVYHRIYARLRNREFSSVEQINQAIEELLESYNERKYKGRDFSRKSLFVQTEKTLLSCLPNERFEVSKTIQAKAQQNGHFFLGEDNHFYSYPYRYAGKQLTIVYNSTSVEAYLDHQRIVFHPRRRIAGGYTTIEQHLPPNLQEVHKYGLWDKEQYLGQARHIGNSVVWAIEAILSSRSFPQQTYRSCLGVLRLKNDHGAERLETACRMLRDNLAKPSYRQILTILQNKTDLAYQPEPPSFTIPSHENIRGAEAFNKPLKQQNL